MARRYAPELWKSVGDALIYTKLLGDHREALTTLNAWMGAVDAYRKRLKAQYPSLDLKSTAWVAGFPVHNAEVVFRSSVQGLRDAEDEDDEVFSNLALLNEFYAAPTGLNLIRDFIGPAIRHRLPPVATFHAEAPGDLDRARAAARPCGPYTAS
ncbi:hypothetical protein V1281_007038 [Nitrobacteraceae bacterium AZCC 2161]